MYDDNLPPGVTPSMLPGCSKQDEINERKLDRADNYDGWLSWLDEDKVKRWFEDYCVENFWNALGKDFLAQLHPDVRAAASRRLLDQDDPIYGIELEWSLFLWMVLAKDRLKILVTAFVESNQDKYDEWVLS